MTRKKKSEEPKGRYHGIIESKYYDFVREEAEREDRSLTATINRIIKKYCHKKYGEEDGLKNKK